MKIGIDARFVGPWGTGIGKYTEKLILNLARIDTKNKYCIFLRRENWDYLALTRHRNFIKVSADIPWYSLKEQFQLPKIFQSQNLDLLHVSHFNVPIFYKGKFVVTIHDLIHHKFSESTATTKNPIVFSFKRFAYQKVIENAVKKSQKIITPSNFVKEDIVRAFSVNHGKIVVTYEAAEEEYSQSQNKNKPGLEKLQTGFEGKWNQQFLIYVGNAYPHKNLTRLLDAMKIINNNSYSSSEPPAGGELRSSRPALLASLRSGPAGRQARTIIKLIIVCSRDVFAERLKKEIKNRELDGKVELKGYLKPAQLAKLFHQAAAYVFPSLSEGFGIPGLNAMASGLPVVCSNIQTLKEIYSDAALYFDPNDPKNIADKIHQVLQDEKTRFDLAKKGSLQVKKYSWLKMAEETLKIYEEAG